jgi:RNA polymerase sigma factor (TIGR02999 family)
MQVASSSRISQLLANWSNGDKNAFNELMPLLYQPLKKLARGYLRRERRDHTLQSAALVNEAYLRLLGDSGIQLNGKTHFFAVAAKIMRHILVEHARHHQAIKRGGGVYKLELEQAEGLGNSRSVDLVALDDALRELSKFDAQQARVVELRFFGGLSIEQTAQILSISTATVKRDWATARVWLYREITRS